MAGANQYSAAEFIDAIPGTGGIIATIAKRVGCTWHTAKKYIDEYATVQQAYQDECETVNDLAESVIIKSIRDGDTATAKWWVSRKRKEVFSERSEVTGADGGPIQHEDVTKMSDDELQRIIED